MIARLLPIHEKLYALWKGNVTSKAYVNQQMSVRDWSYSVYYKTIVWRMSDNTMKDGASFSGL